MNRPIRWVGVGVMALFVVLFLQLNYLQIVHASALQHNTLNNEQIVKDYNLPRGDIVSSDGVTLAYSTRAPKSSNFAFVRHYPTGSLFGQVTGYYSFIYGSNGVEQTYNDLLVGTKHSFDFPSTFSLSEISKLLLNSSTAEDVTLTLSDKLQKEAQTELAGKDGSIVALNPQTGAILAMYSNPSYNPSGLSSVSTVRETQDWKSLLNASGNPLSAGAYSNRWFPGSTFKVITSSAVYDHDQSLATKVYPTVSSIQLPDTTATFHNFGYESCGGSLPELFTVSCDTGFAEVGLNLGANNLEAEAKAFGFDATVPLDLPNVAQSYFPPASSFSQNLPTLAYSAIGQENVSATPLEMAMVAGAIADKGKMMTPHVFEKATNNQDQVTSTYKPKLWRQATSASTAAQLTTMMESVVNSANGTGTAAAISGVEVAGKTGTAQTQVNGTDETDDWMIAFAPANNPTIAVAVLIPDQPSADDYQGGTVAAPLAKAMIETYLATHPASSSTSSSTSTTTTTAPTVTRTTVATTTPTTVKTSTTTSATTTPTTVVTTTTPTTTKTTSTTAKGG